MPKRQWFEELEFDLPSALLAQLTELFSQMPQGPLDEATVQEVDDAQGVYQLFLNDELVYIGKTDAEAGLRARLLRHSKKIQSRLNLDHKRITFKAVRVYVFTAMDLEELLIKHYKNDDIPLSWNLSGFGSNDPGRKRDETTLKPGHFDKLYPIDLDIVAEISKTASVMTVADVLGQLKQMLAYTVRFQGNPKSPKKPHPDLVDTFVSLKSSNDTVRHLLQQIKTALGKEWQITALPGYVILYKEKKDYHEGKVIEAAP